jgi:thioredoxin 1
MGQGVLEFTDGNFQNEVLDSSVPVLVDFWAPWCGPCKQLAPTIDELATDFAGKALIGKVNTDENPQIAIDYQINAIPTVLLFKGGQPVEKFVGLTPKDRFASALNGHL